MEQVFQKSSLRKSLSTRQPKATPSEVSLPSKDAELAAAYLHRGEMLLLKGGLEEAIRSLEMAQQLDPENYDLLFRQGLALFEAGTEEGREQLLLLANRKFQKATKLAPLFFEAWQLWGSSLLKLGQAHQEKHYFQRAIEKLEKAISCSEHQVQDTLAELYWDHAAALAEIAERDGELDQFHNTMLSFERAVQTGSPLPPEFWHDYGCAALDSSDRVQDVRLLVKSIHCFKQAVSVGKPARAIDWAGLARALQTLSDSTHEEDHFAQANECYAAAAQLDPRDPEIWLDWARFLGSAGRTYKDVKKLRACLEKCAKAHACDRDDPLILAVWAEGLAYLGSLSDRLDLISEAQNKIAEALELDEEHPEIWYSYGMVLRVMGEYFADSDFYLQAVERFQQGLSIDRSYSDLWHAMATCYLLYGQMESDADAFEKAIKFYKKALDIEVKSAYLFDYGLAHSKYGEILRDQKYLETAVLHFEKAIHLQKNAIYIHPEWLFQYATALDLLGDFYDEDSYYQRAAEIFTHVQTIDPEFPSIHHKLGLVHSHLGELYGDTQQFLRALHHFRLAAKQEEENDLVLLDWGLALINLAHHTSESEERERLFEQALRKLSLSAKAGNLQAYYQLACLYSLLGVLDQSMLFLERAASYDAVPPLEEILQDEWLESLRATEAFLQFAQKIESRARSREEI